MKNQKGITLVALVVTIVVLLILAGVSIAMLTGDNGIITNAQESKYANTEGEVIDRVLLGYNALYTEITVKKALNADYDATKHLSDLKDILDKDFGSDNNYTISIDDSANTISIVYADGVFEGETTAAEGAKYPEIKYIFTVKTDSISISDYSRKVGTTTAESGT